MENHLRQLKISLGQWGKYSGGRIKIDGFLDDEVGSEGELDGVNVDVNQLGVTMTKSPISRDQNQLVKPTAGEPEGY